VPAPNGYQQPFGAEYRAEVLEHITSAQANRLLLELRDAYPGEADLASLRRTVTLDRTAPDGTIELVDEVTFANEDGTLESALVTFARVEIDPSRVTVHGDHGQAFIDFDPEHVDARIDTLPQVDLCPARETCSVSCSRCTTLCETGRYGWSLRSARMPDILLRA
jgi:hypothetical protein